MRGTLREVRSRLATAALLSLTAWVVCAGLDRPFGNGDEVIYAQGVREMLESGDFLTLHWQGKPVLQRPTLPFALAAVGASVSDGESGMRASSALAGLCLLGLLYVALEHRFRRRDVALLGVLACASAPTWRAYGVLLLSDPWFVVGTTLALIATLRAVRDPRAFVLVGVGLGWACACKSLAVCIAIAALLPAWLGLLWARPEVRPDPKLIGRALLAFTLLGAPFYALGFARHGAAFFEQHFVYSLAKRAAGQLGTGSMGGPTAYLEWMWRADGPLVCAIMLGAVVVATYLGARRRDPELLALPITAAALLLVCSALGSRLPHYLLPLYPVLALTLAYAYAAATEHAALGAVRSFYAPALMLIVLVVGLPDRSAEVHLKYDDAAAILGARAARVAAPGATVYAHEWYAPALGYYARRPFRLTTSFGQRYRALRSVDFFVNAGVPALVPPSPVPAGERMLVAGPAPELAAAAWMRVDKVLAAANGIFLVEASAVEHDLSAQR